MLFHHDPSTLRSGFVGPQGGYWKSSFCENISIEYAEQVRTKKQYGMYKDKYVYESIGVCRISRKTTNTKACLEILSNSVIDE